MAGTLKTLIAALRRQHGAQELPCPADPWSLIVWENIAYLADDERHAAAFAALEASIGLEPEALLAASPTALTAAARRGGPHAAKRAARLHDAADRVLSEHDGDLSGVLDLPTRKALSALRRFPAIGAPGAEKILMLCGAAPLLALESNGLRVLLRYGYGSEAANYAATYRSVQDAIAGELSSSTAWLTQAHLLLRRHGRETCRRQRPACDACAARRDCEHPRRSDSRARG